MKKYDTTFIIDGTLGVDEREALIRRFGEILEKLGGKMDRIVRWGMRTLAYEIKRRRQGYYVIFYYDGESEAIKPFERELGINENVLRFMTVLSDGTLPAYIPDEGAKRSPSYAASPSEKNDAPEANEAEEKAAESLDYLDSEVQDEADDQLPGEETVEEEGEIEAVPAESEESDEDSEHKDETEESTDKEVE